MYEDVNIKLPNRFRFDIALESSCNDITPKDARRIAKILDDGGNFVFTIDREKILRQLNLYVYSHDYDDLKELSEIAGVNKKILPLTKKWFLNISMSQAYSIIKNCMPFFERKKPLFSLFLNFFEARKNVRTADDIAELELLVNTLKVKVTEFKAKTGANYEHD